MAGDDDLRSLVNEIVNEGNSLTDWEREFIHNIDGYKDLTTLSTPQRESLFKIHQMRVDRRLRGV